MLVLDDLSTCNPYPRNRYSDSTYEDLCIGARNSVAGQTRARYMSSNRRRARPHSSG